MLFIQEYDCRHSQLNQTNRCCSYHIRHTCYKNPKIPPHSWGSAVSNWDSCVGGLVSDWLLFFIKQYLRVYNIFQVKTSHVRGISWQLDACPILFFQLRFFRSPAAADWSGKAVPMTRVTNELCLYDTQHQNKLDKHISDVHTTQNSLNNSWKMTAEHSNQSINQSINPSLFQALSP